MINADRSATEAEVNRDLRRVDWRFLLPDPQPSRVRCPSGGRLARALDLIAPPGIQSGPPYDLVVAVNPKGSILSGAFAALEPGGAFSGEWWWPRPGGAARVRRTLEHVGFVDVRLYCPVPPPLGGWPGFWLPLDAPDAARAFLLDHPAARSLPRRLRLHAWDLGRRSGCLAPVVAVARKPGAGPHGARTVAGVDLAAALDTRPIDTILLTGGQRSRNKVVALLYQDGEPCLALKMTRTPESIPGLRREATVLRAIEKVAPRVGGIPTVEVVHDGGRWLTVAEAALRGRPLYHQLRPDTYRELCLRVTEWLTRLASITRSDQPQAWWKRIAAPTLTEFLETWGRDVPRDLAARASATLQGVGQLPIVCEHRDCSPWNVSLSDSGACMLLDWESAERTGTPAADLVYFLTYMALFLAGTVDSGREEDTYADLLDPATPIGAVTSECLALYCRAIGLEPAVLPAIRLWTWMIHARSERERLLEDSDPGPLTGPDRSLFVRLWREEVLRLGS